MSILAHLNKIHKFYVSYGSGGLKYLRDISSKKQGLITVNLKTLDHPVYLRPETSDINVFRQNILKSEYNIHMPFEPETMIDLGANIGLASVFFKQRYPDLRIVCVEPDLQNFEMLEKNLAPYSGIQCYHHAIWHKKARIELQNNGIENNFWGLRTAETDDPGGLETITIPEILADTGWDSVDILKVDIEGAEFDLFSPDNCDWLDKVRIVIIEFHDRFRAGTARAVFRALDRYDYRFQTSGENCVFYIGESN